MNDDFLYRLRSKPSPAFAERLKNKLDRETVAALARKRALRWSAAVGVLLCGTSFAIMSPSVRSFAVTVINMFRSSESSTVSMETGRDSAREERGSAANGLHSELWRDQRVPWPARNASQNLESGTSEEAADRGDNGSTPASSAADTQGSANRPAIAGAGDARESIRILSASPTYPLTLKVAESFGRTGAFKTPQVQQMGGQDAFWLFCRGVGKDYADIADATRRMASDDIERCYRSSVVEIQFGYLAVTLARSNSSSSLRLSPRDLHLALVEQIPDPAHPQGARVNRYTTWQQINPALPNEPIRVLGPPPDSELYRMFMELVLAAGCTAFASNKELGRYRHLCYSLRQDGVYVDAGENEAIIMQQIVTSPGTVGIFSYNFLERNKDQLVASPLDGFEPVLENVVSGKYPASRTLYLYVKKAHLRLAPGLRPFVAAYMSEKTIGPRGSLVDLGLIPLPDKQRAAMRRHAEAFNSLQLEDPRRKR